MRLKPVFLLLFLLLSACGPDTPNTEVFQNTIKLVPDRAALKVGDTISLKAVYYNSSNKIESVNFQWLISDNTIVSVDANGSVTAKKEGSVLITAFYNGVTSKAAKIDVSLTPEIVKDSKKGTFIKADQNVTGTAILEKQTNNSLKLSFSSNFSVNSGPDLHIYLSNEQSVVSQSLLLRPIISNTGSQSYDVPLGVNLSDYQYVLIHCKKYNHRFAYAKLE